MANGRADKTFGSGGSVVTDFAGHSTDDFASAIALQRDSKAVLAGSFSGKTAASSSLKIALARYLPTYCFVPNVKSRLLAVATLAITKANCATGKIQRVGSATVPAGRVITQTPAAGTQRPEDARVALVVSRGSR